MKEDYIAHSATILGTKSVTDSISYYVNMLGFKLNYSWEDPPSYAVLKRGSTSIHLAQRSEMKISDHPVIYIFCYDIDGLYEELCSRQIELLEALSDSSDYGMREFTIKDNNGYKIIFGSEE